MQQLLQFELISGGIQPKKQNPMFDGWNAAHFC
jgi:hypothetical protein